MIQNIIDILRGKKILAVNLMQTNMYKIIKTNTDKNENYNYKKIDVLINLTGNEYDNIDSGFYRNIICVCGSCDLHIEKSGRKEVIKLNQPNKTIKLGKDVSAKLINYIADTRVVIEYYEENNEL